MSNGLGSNVNIAQVNPLVERTLNAKAHATYGFTLLTSTSNFEAGAGIAPIGHYTGFIIGDNGATITSATFHDTTVNTFATGESYVTANFPFTAGQYYPFPSGKTLTITAGNLILIHEEGK